MSAGNLNTSPISWLRGCGSWGKQKGISGFYGLQWHSSEFSRL
jgi:hypothetical protein